MPHSTAWMGGQPRGREQHLGRSLPAHAGGEEQAARRLRRHSHPTNGVRNRASSAARTRSQCGSIVKPIPTAAPFTAATSRLVERLQGFEENREARNRPPRPQPAGPSRQGPDRPRRPGRRPSRRRPSPCRRRRRHRAPCQRPRSEKRVEGIERLWPVQRQQADPRPVGGVSWRGPAGRRRYLTHRQVGTPAAEGGAAGQPARRRRDRRAATFSRVAQRSERSAPRPVREVSMKTPEQSSAAHVPNR